jgi:hypothetical protein
MFVSKVYAVHLQKVPTSILHSKYGFQIGGLALAAAAVRIPISASGWR